MELDHVKIVGVHAGQALFHACQDIVTREDMRIALAARGRGSTHQAAAFAREIVFRAPIGNVAANTLFADAIVDRGIDIIDAGVERSMENGFCLGLGHISATRSATEFHGAVAQHGDLESRPSEFPLWVAQSFLSPFDTALLALALPEVTSCQRPCSGQWQSGPEVPCLGNVPHSIMCRVDRV